jgi:hypothetical protein
MPRFSVSPNLFEQAGLGPLPFPDSAFVSRFLTLNTRREKALRISQTMAIQALLSVSYAA